MKKEYFIALSLCLTFLFSCNNLYKCDFPVQIMYGVITPDNYIEVLIDKKRKIRKQFSGMHMAYLNKDYIVQNYCTKDSIINIEVRANKLIDTLFTIEPKKIHSCYIEYGENGQNFKIRYIYRQPFDGPNRIEFEDW